MAGRKAAVDPLATTWSAIAGVSLNAAGTSAAIDTTGADLLVVSVAGAGVAPVTVTDSKGNTWRLALNGSLTPQAAIHYCQGGVVGPGHTFTVATTRQFPAFSVGAFSGSVANPLDQTASSPSVAGVASNTVGPITPTVANALVISGFATSGATTGAAGFTTLTSAPVGSNFGSFLAYQTQTAPTAVTAVWDADANAVQALLASFKPRTGDDMATVGATPPASPTQGQLWWNSTTGQLMIYYDDGTSQQWVVAVNQVPGGNIATTKKQPRAEVTDGS